MLQVKIINEDKLTVNSNSDSLLDWLHPCVHHSMSVWTHICMRSVMKSPVSWCSESQLKLSINRTTQFVVDHHALNADMLKNT